MNVREPFLDALESIRANKLRAFLTMLGIVIGVAAVISMLAIGTGAQSSITSEIEGAGATVLYISAGGEASNPQPLTTMDVEALRDQDIAPDVRSVAPILQGNATVTTPGISLQTQIYGVTPEYFDLQEVDLSIGQLFTEAQVDNAETIALIGSSVAEDLGGNYFELIGSQIRIEGQTFRVVGIMAEEGGTGFGSSDNRILIPFSTAQTRLLRREAVGEVDQIYVAATSSETVEAATEQITQILRARHNRNLGLQDFDILSTQSLLETVQSISSTFTLFLGGIAGISLLVGGIGIMNIMLVSVIERTREIGLRKALGARNTDILSQFLIESSVISLGGGLVGILVGILISTLISGINVGTGAINAVVSTNSILLATLFSAAVGIFFGIYPANQAAKLEPVDALRSE